MVKLLKGMGSLSKSIYRNCSEDNSSIVVDSESEYEALPNMLDLVLEDFSQIDLSKISLPNFVVYYNSKDYPGQYVIRLWDANGLKATNCIVIGETLQQVRISLPFGLTRFPRAVDDDPQILETWI